MKKALLCVLLVTAFSGCTPSADKKEVKKVINLGVEVNVDKSGELFTVSPEKIIQVLPFRGNIPPIDNPKFLSASEASALLRDDDAVIGLSYGNTVRAYPVKIMRWHIVVNDSIGETPILISYDPMSDVALASRRVILEKELRFKTSDKIYNSNPVLVDDATKTRWSQFLGEAVEGRLAGQKLEPLPVAVVSWRDWKNEYPETVSLSIDTGYVRDYEKNMYEDYYRINHLMYDVENEDDRLPNKATIYGIEVDGSFKAYPAVELRREETVTDEVSGVPVRLTLNGNGILSVKRADSDEELMARRLFWFSWAAFHPGTELYLQEDQGSSI